MNYSKKEVILIDNVEIVNYLPELGIENTREEIMRGLLAREKYISSKFFYDEKGSGLFVDITQLEEYYPTRTEKKILESIACKLMGNLENTDIIELGSGDCSKIDILLKQIPKENLSSINYIPVDVSMSTIEKSADDLVELYPELNIQGFVADFINQIHLLPSYNRRLFCFFGSTIGNLENIDAEELLLNLSKSMKKGDKLLLGMDLVKSLKVLHDAYNDSKGVTAHFNKNITQVINHIIGTNFNLNDFEHKAFFNKEKSRIEMHLIALKEMHIYASKTDQQIHIQKGENIHTENSHKYSNEDICRFSSITGLNINKIHTDENNWFALVEFEK